MKIEHQQYIAEIKLIKKTNIQVSLLTCNQYDITRQTLKKLFNQKNIKFDILLIDNGSQDYKKIIKEFPQINYVLLKENIGSGGAHRVGGEISLSYKYKYTIITDNDAVLIKNDSLAKMKSKIERNHIIGAVIPFWVDKYQAPCPQDFETNWCTFHYFFVKNEILKKIGLFSMEAFLYGDDLLLSSKVHSVSKIIVCHDVPYYHYFFSPKNLENKYFYYAQICSLVMIFKEKNIMLAKRLFGLRIFLYRIFQLTFFSIYFKDFSYIQTIWYSFFAFLLKKNLLAKIGINKFSLKEISEKELNQKIKIANVHQMSYLILPEQCYYYSVYYNKFFFYQRQKN